MGRSWREDSAESFALRGFKLKGLTLSRSEVWELGEAVYNDVPDRGARVHRPHRTAGLYPSWSGGAVEHTDRKDPPSRQRRILSIHLEDSAFLRSNVALFRPTWTSRCRSVLSRIFAMDDHTRGEGDSACCTLDCRRQAPELEEHGSSLA